MIFDGKFFLYTHVSKGIQRAVMNWYITHISTSHSVTGVFKEVPVYKIIYIYIYYGSVFALGELFTCNEEYK